MVAFEAVVCGNVWDIVCDGRNWATPIFIYFFTELPVPPHVAGVIGTWLCALKNIYNFKHYGLIFGP